MMDLEIVRMMRTHFESLFPKVCPNCGRNFATLHAYIQSTKRIGPTISYDAELKDLKTAKPIGAVAHTNCPCGSTLGLTTEGMPLDQIHRVLHWVRVESEAQGVGPEVVIDTIRDEIRRQILAEAEDAKPV